MRTAPFADALVGLARCRDDIVVLSADLSKYTDLMPFATEFPHRFVQVGMAEQNMMGVAGGLAKRGYLPIAVTYGVFASRRAYDQIAMALATGPSNAVVVGFLPGITTPFRATHQAVDDLAIMRALPGISVVDPADATELSAALVAAVEFPGLVYMRGLRGQVAELFPPERFSFEIGRATTLRSGTDVGVISTGLATQWVAEAVKHLEHAGVSVGVLHVATLKPIDRNSLIAFCMKYPAVTTVENHSVIGGLGSAVAETLASAGVATTVHTLGVPDRWADAGSVDHIRQALGLNTGSLAAAIGRGAK